MAGSIKPRRNGAVEEPPHDRRLEHHHGAVGAKSHKDQGRPCHRGTANSPLPNTQANHRRRSIHQRTRPLRPQGAGPATKAHTRPPRGWERTQPVGPRANGPDRAPPQSSPRSRGPGPTAGRIGEGVNGHRPTAARAAVRLPHCRLPGRVPGPAAVAAPVAAGPPSTGQIRPPRVRIRPP
jgi:hypothetical protein